MAQVGNNQSQFGGEFMIQDSDHLSGLDQSGTNRQADQSQDRNRQQGGGDQRASRQQGGEQSTGNQRQSY